MAPGVQCSDRGRETAAVGRSSDPLHAGSRGVSRLAALLAFAAARLAAAPAAPAEGIQPPAVAMDAFQVSAQSDDDSYDDTGMGSVEEEMQDSPFANELTQTLDPELDDDLDADTDDALAVTSGATPVERAMGEARLNLRGFPTPMLRNGFVLLGIPETLNTARTVVIQGPLVPVLGRAAPGGIRNYMTARPKARAGVWLSGLATSHDRRQASVQATGPLVPRHLWQRVAATWMQRNGPEAFARQTFRSLNTGLTWREGRRFSAMLTGDFLEVAADAAPGIPVYRPATGGKIAGPYLPLARFNANGPDAGVRRRSTTLGLQVDSQPTPQLSLRAGVEGWSRHVTQDRFTSAVYSLATGLFEGTREPRHIDMPQDALAGHLEATVRGTILGMDHKILSSASYTRGEYTREERALPTSARDALPADVRLFDPYAPDFYLPAYDPSVYSKITADRRETAGYGAAELSDRVAVDGGRWVFTYGARYDEVDLTIDDRKPGALFPRYSSNPSQLSHFAGVNVQILSNRLLAFASTSTAFDPSVQVDSRTGRIQAPETTLGYEIGLKGRSADRHWDANGAVFLLMNRGIARRNPLYDDPIADASQTQPQFGAAAEERFEGARLQVRWQPTPTLTVGMKTVYVNAVATRSPSLPAEVGRPLERMPAFTGSLRLLYRPSAPVSGFNAGLGLQAVGRYVANYENATRAYLSYPGYALVSGQLGYTWRTARRMLALTFGVRNALNRDLLATNARLGTDREYSLSTRLFF